MTALFASLETVVLFLGRLAYADTDLVMFPVEQVLRYVMPN